VSSTHKRRLNEIGGPTWYTQTCNSDSDVLLVRRSSQVAQCKTRTWTWMCKS